MEVAMLKAYKKAPFTVLEYGRCSWGACYFCGWGKKRANTTLEQLKAKYTRFLERQGGARIIKLFSSGSMIDPRQFPLDFTRWLIEEAKKAGVREIVIEGKSDDVTRENIEAVRVEGIRVTIAIGLEAADDIILKRYYRKNTGVADYIRAAELLRETGFGLRSYIIVNAHPVVYRNMEVQEEVLERTIVLAGQYSDSIVVINAYPHQNTRLALDWIEGRWRPLDKRQFYSLVGRVLSRLGARRVEDDLYEYRGIPVELDHSNFAFVPKIPRRLWTRIRGVGREILLHPHFEVWQDYFERFYEPPRGKEYALLLPCSYRKPYRKSKTHRAILSAISGYNWFPKLHLIVVSTPGVIPWEFHDRYPFTHYDWPEWMETEEVKRDYILVTKERVKRYLRAHGGKYKLFFAYFHLESETLEAIRQAFRELGMEDKLVEVLDRETYEAIKRELGKERVGSSVVRHPLALERLRRVLKTYLEGTAGNTINAPNSSG
ncbi:MAG: DUF5591 domain-containing protein [Desulfurococcales archaeon]|nr:DUF5591 domain-containing protein [Desulfurococcales archaeon]